MKVIDEQGFETPEFRQLCGQVYQLVRDAFNGVAVDEQDNFRELIIETINRAT